MSFRLAPKIGDFERQMAFTLRYFSEFGKHAFQHIHVTNHPSRTQPSIPPGSVNEYQLWLGR